MSHAAAAVGGNADGTIPLRAAQWAVRILQEAAIPAPQMQASIESGTTSFELRILKGESAFRVPPPCLAFI